MSDFEKSQDLEKLPVTSTPPTEEGSVTSVSYEGPKSRGLWHDFLDSFKRADLAHIDTSHMSEQEIHNYLTSRAPLKRELKGWQISLIAIGGSIGSGLFIGSGNSFATGGQAGVVIGFSVVSVMIFATMMSLGELAVRYPVNGAFLAFVTRFVDPAWSLAMGWNYLLQWLVTFPLELISTSITLSYWDSDNNGATNVSKAAWVSLFYAVCVFMNMFGAKGYGWGESILAIIKVVAVIAFCIFAVCVTCGGYPGHYAENNLAHSPYYALRPDTKYIGGWFWAHPLAFADQAKGVFSVLVNAAFSFAGTELSGLAAAETENPRRALPRAVKQVFWRVVLFYIISLALVGCLVPWDDNRFGATSDGSSSPFVIAISNANVKALPSIFNTVICLAVFSVGNSCVYAASRTVASLAAQGFAPRFFAYIDREGRPLMGIALVAIFGLLCFLVASDKYGEVFDWMLALSGLSSVFTWGSINLAHIRFRMAMHIQGRSLDELPFKAIGGVWTSWVGFLINLAIIGLQFWIAVWPVGESPDAEAFFESYLSVPVVIAFYIVARIWMKQKSWYVKLSDIDLDEGMRTHDIEELKRQNLEEEEFKRNQKFMVRCYNFWC